MTYESDRKPRFFCTDQDALLTILLEAVFETERVIGHVPTKQQVLDHLFSEMRDDPEARDLERRLDPALKRVLADWEQMNEHRPE